jgi:hypothetical protein
MPKVNRDVSIIVGSGKEFGVSSPAWVFLPVFGESLAHAHVLRWNLAPALRHAISRRRFAWVADPSRKAGGDQGR